MMENIKALHVEEAVLGSIIIDNTLVDKLDELKVGMFTRSENQNVFQAMLSLKKSKLIIDIQSVASKLVDMNQGINISYLSELTIMSNTYSIDSHIQILKDKSMRREAVSLCAGLIEKLASEDDIQGSLYNFESRFRSILEEEKAEEDDCVNISQKIFDFLEKDGDIGFSFGIELLDDVIGGLFKGELTTIAARSGVGKTALALQIMLNASKQGKKVLFISREMSNEQIFMRNLSKNTGISIQKMKSKQLEAEEWRLIVKGMESLCEGNLIYINDRISTVSAMKKRIRQIRPDLVIVDYIQLMSVEGSAYSREREVAGLSREIKNITLDFMIPVIQLSQLNDEMKDSRPWGERPMRDSKAIFHDSNNVIYIHEPVGGDFMKAVDDIGQDEKRVLAARSEGVKLLDLIVAKCRDGQTQYKHYCYNGPRLHFQKIEY